MTAYLFDGTRTAIGKINGAYRGLKAVDLGAHAAGSLLSRHPELGVDRVVLGNVLQAGVGQNPAHQVSILAGLDHNIPATTINDVCLASLTSIGLAADWISLGRYDVVLAGGFESMTGAPHLVRFREGHGYGSIVAFDAVEIDGLTDTATGSSMGVLSDRENERLGIGRGRQDDIAVMSHRRAAAATESGRFSLEISPTSTQDGQVEQDEGIRGNATPEALAQLPPAFRDGGTITAGNSSQLSDAACAVMVVSEKALESVERSVAPLARIVGWGSVAGRDSTLHLRPAEAAGRLLAESGLTPGDIDLWEINEAFAGVVDASTRDLDIHLDKVNVNGGAIALGHPFAATAARLVLTLAIELRERSLRLGVATLCGGGGQGAAVLLESVA